MQHFQSILIVIGLIAIGGVLIHGYLLSRKGKVVAPEETVNNDSSEETTFEMSADVVDDVLGEVRIIGANNEAENDQEIDFSNVLDDEKIEEIQFSETPVATENLIEAVEEPASVPEEKPSEAASQQDLFIFNVVAKEEAHLGGHELLQFFLTSGFRFGAMSIFHRHEHSDGTGPVLFSIANMMAPGIFDPNGMEQFKSEGVSFFLTAPNDHINIKESFEMMLRAVEQMAEEFDCMVLNANREPMTKEQFIEYNHRLLHYI